MGKNNRVEKIKIDKNRTEQQDEIIKLVKVLAVVLLVILTVYFFTRIFITKDLFSNNAEDRVVTPGTINYDTTIIGQIFDKPESEYYVAIYDRSANEAMYYAKLIQLYSENTDAKPLRVYFADLENEIFNRSYYTEEENEINVNTTDLTKFKVGKLTLLRIKDGQIVKAIQTKDDFVAELTVEKK